MVTPSPASDRIAVIVPVAREENEAQKDFLERVFGETPELVDVVCAADEAVSPTVLEAFSRAGARVLLSDAPRGARLSAAAAASDAEILLFLHTDTMLPEGWASSVRDAIASGAVGGAFRLSFSGGGARMRWVAFWANARTAFTRVPYGDQAPFVRRDVHERLGGHPPWPLLDDWDFARRLREEGRIEILRDAVETSPRRYLERGVARTIWKNWKTLWRFRRGASPEDLARDYRK
jgi:rSAM/selenodomain-associated transferase 2